MWLKQRWADLFHADFEVLLYDLTSTYFEGEMEQNEKAKRGYSRDGRPDCLQLVIYSGRLPAGLRSDAWQHRRLHHTARFLDQIEKTHGKAKRM